MTRNVERSTSDAPLKDAVQICEPEGNGKSDTEELREVEIYGCVPFPFSRPAKGFDP